MQSISDLIQQDSFSRKDLKDIIIFCRVENDLSPLCAVAYITKEFNLSEDEILSLSKLLAKNKELAYKF
jgi:hypothetical protein